MWKQHPSAHPTQQKHVEEEANIQIFKYSSSLDVTKQRLLSCSIIHNSPIWADPRRVRGMDPWLRVTRARTWQWCRNGDLALWGYLFAIPVQPFLRPCLNVFQTPSSPHTICGVRARWNSWLMSYSHSLLPSRSWYTSQHSREPALNFCQYLI